MINIVSRAYLSKYPTGPKKVVDNFIKGLDKIGYPYVVNKRLDSCKRLWIHDDHLAFKCAQKKVKKFIVGPNVFLKKEDLSGLDYNNIVYLHPSQWAKDFYSQCFFDYKNAEPWPVGIDTDEFRPIDNKKEIVGIYFKQRYPAELEAVKNILDQKGIRYEIIKYPGYQERVYKDILSRSKYMIWLGRHETQGIAFQEALSSGVPILVWEIKNLGQWAPVGKEAEFFNDQQNSFSGALSAPYFDQNCGMKIYEKQELPDAIDFMEKQYSVFSPREYILENLSLEKQAKELLYFFENKFDFLVKDGYNEKLIKKGDWINNNRCFQVGINSYRGARKFLRKLWR